MRQCFQLFTSNPTSVSVIKLIMDAGFESQPVGQCLYETHLESHVCHLSRRNQLAALRHGDGRDEVRVAGQDVLLVCLQVLDDQAAADRVDHVVGVRVNVQAS